MATDGWQLRMVGLGLPFGIIAGFGAYTAVAAFLHAGEQPDRTDLPRQMLIIALLAALAAHYLEIHFGIAIGATRTTFWVFTAVLMLIGMRQLAVMPAELTLVAEEAAPEPVAPSPTGKRGKQAARQAPAPRRRAPVSNAARLPKTVMTDVLVFLTFVYIYSTNATGLTNPGSVLFESAFVRPNNALIPPIFVLMLFTWLVAAIIGLAEESMSQRRAPAMGWWWAGLGLHALVVWGA